MSKKKKVAKKLTKHGKARDIAPGSSPEGRSTVASDTAQSEEHRDPRDGTAAILPVTGAMMDHAAQAAAALADGVAHHTFPLDARAAAEPVPDDAEQPVVASAGATHIRSAAKIEAAHDAVAASDGAMGEARAAAAPFTRETADGAERGPEAPRDASPDPVDALALYNAKLLEVMRVNAASTTALFASLVQARSVPEALSLNADHLRRQMEALTSQGRELATLAQRIALGALQPFKGSTEP